MQTVLLVEDQEQVRVVVHRLLDRLGFAVLVAPDGESALELSEDHPGPIHLLLTDVVMPGINGADLASRLGAERIGVRTIYMSGYPTDVLVRELGVDDAFAVLPKPFTELQLRSTIQSLIGLSEMAG